MIPAAFPSGSSYHAQYLSRRHPHHALHTQQQRLVTDKEGYLRHLEAQLGRVEEACDAAAATQARQEDVERKLAALREVEGQRAAAWVELEEARARDAEALRALGQRVEGAERLGDRCVRACVRSSMSLYCWITPASSPRLASKPNLHNHKH